MTDFKYFVITVAFLLMGSGTDIMAADDAKGKLLMDVAETCVSGNHEPADCQLMRQGAETFDISELAVLAEMRENRVLDIGCKQELAAVTSLLTYAEQYYGKGSREAIDCRRRVVGNYSNSNWEKATALAKENETYAIDLSKKKPKDKDITLLKIVTRLEYLTLKNQREIENPVSWEQVLEMEKDVEPYVMDSTYHSTLIIDICDYLANWKTNRMSYNDFSMYADYLVRRIFPEGFKMLGWITNGEVDNSEGYYRRALDSARILWGEKDLRTIFAELRLLSCIRTLPSGDYEPQHGRLQELQDYLTAYLAPGDLGAIETELIKWEFDIYFNQNLSEIRSPYPMLMRIEKAYGEKNEMYLNYLHRLMNLQIYLDPEKASQLAVEEGQLLDNLYEHLPDMKVAYLIGMYSVMEALSTNDQSIFQNYFTRLCETYRENHNPSWISIYIGRSITEIYAYKLQIFDVAADYYKTVLDDMNLISDKDSPLFAACLSYYVSLLSMANDTDIQKKAIGIADDVIAINKKYNISTAGVYHTKSNIAFHLGDNESGIQYLRDGILSCIRPVDGMWRCLMQLELANRLHPDKTSQTLSQEVKALYEKAIPFFMEHKEAAHGYYLKGYLFIADYYWTNRQYDEAENMYLQGMEHCESISGEFDDIYMGLVNDLYALYANGMNDMDKADKLVEICMANVEARPSIRNNYAILQLLWNRYHLLVNKRVDLILQVTALNDIAEMIQRMAKIAGADAIQIKHYFNEFLDAWSNQFANLGRLRSEAQDLLTSEEEEIKTVSYRITDFIEKAKETMMSSDIISYIQEEIDNLKRDGVKDDDSRFGFLYGFMANYHLYLMNDTIKGEEYYNKLLNIPAERANALSCLSNLRFSQGQFRQAASYVEELMREPNYSDYQSIRTKVYDASILSSCYYRTGQYQKALIYAREVYHYQQQRISQNFDLLTQSEREAFVKSGGGAGSDHLCVLLPKFPKQLAKEVYDAILTEKGLQLRASERIKKGILKSRDSALIALQDTLNMLSAQYKMMNTGTDWEHGNYEYDPKVVKTRQQIETLERSINRQAAQFIEGMNTPDWKKLQSVLKQGEAAVEYVFSDSMICALVLLPVGEPQYVPLTFVNQLWTELYKITELSAKQKSDALYEKDLLHLYDRLWLPMESHLNHVKTVFYSPTGDLNELAFAAFKCSDGRYLSDHYELHQMLSTGDLVALREHSATAPIKSAQLYGSVYYSPEHEQLAQQIVQGNGQRGKADDQRGAILDDGEAFGYLSFTKEEVERVNSILINKQVETRQLTGFSPTEEALHAISEKSPDVLHLSTHGFFIKGDKEAKENKFLKRFPSMQFSSMQRSGLALVGANRTWEGTTDKPEEADGIITANEVALLDLSQTRLAVLSACQTAVGQSSMEGVYGMHRGFKQAGVKSILASLWNVNDKSTARLMELFYRNWLSGIPMQQSLNEAVRELRKEYPSPFYWAPFVLLDAEN